MPRNVRNFWIQADIDGRKTKTRSSGYNIACGPQAASGGFFLRVLIRKEGGIMNGLDVTGRAQEDGTLELIVEPNPDLAEAMEVEPGRGTRGGRNPVPSRITLRSKR